MDKSRRCIHFSSQHQSLVWRSIVPKRSEKPESISIVLSTYNAPLWLEKSLWGFANQSVQPNEILVADDGSDERTKEVIEKVSHETDLKIQRVWHTDQGFRKCVILNRAIEQASSDYLIFSDGDCIPRGDFIWQHINHAKQKQFLSGGYNKLSMTLSQKINLNDIATGKIFQSDWLRQNGHPFGRQSIRLHTKGRFAGVLNRLTTTQPTWNGHNASGWLSDLIKVNGFDERMRYGGEDCELGERLVNMGVKPKQIRFSAICLHLDHERGYVNEADKRRNMEIRQATRRNRTTYTEHGLHQLVTRAA